MTPSTTSRPKLTTAWDKTHERVVGGKRPSPPAAGEEQNDAPATPPASAPKMERTEFKVLNIRIPKDVHKMLRRISIDTEQSLQSIVIQALAQYAQKRAEEV